MELQRWKKGKRKGEEGDSQKGKKSWRGGGGGDEDGGGCRWRGEECEEVKGGSQVVGCWWHSLTGAHPQRLAVPLCFVLHLVKRKYTVSVWFSSDCLLTNKVPRPNGDEA